MKALTLQSLLEGVDPSYDLMVTVYDPLSNEYYDMEICGIKVDETTESVTMDLFEWDTGQDDGEDDHHEDEDLEAAIEVDTVTGEIKNTSVAKVDLKQACLAGLLTFKNKAVDVIIKPKMPELEVKML